MHVEEVDQGDRAQLAEALANLNHAARRKVPKVGSDTLPTPWDRVHADINILLTLYELADH